MRIAALLLLLAAAASPAPGRHLNYAESSNRLVYAFVFGSKSTVRVIRRTRPPPIELGQFLRRPPGASHRGEAGDTIVAEFDFRGDRPVHMVPTNAGNHLIAFVNRAPDGKPPESDRIHVLKERHYGPVLDYGALPRDTPVDWPEFPRALRKAKPEPPPKPRLLNYAFVSKELDEGRVLVARQTEDGRGPAGEYVCFLVDVVALKVALPAPAELTALLQEDEPLFRAGAAWALGHLGDRAHLGALRAALGRTEESSAKAEIARAIVRCGDAGGRRTLRALLNDERAPVGRAAAAAMFASLPPDRGDGAALAEAAVSPAGAIAGPAGRALVALGAGATNPLLKMSRATEPATRVASARLLARLDDAAAEKRLLGLVRDGAKEVQNAAATALTAPPRAILPANHGEFARALQATKRLRNNKAARRLSILAAHAGIQHDKVLEALVDLAPFEAKAIWSLARLTKEPLTTPADCKAWWKRR